MNEKQQETYDILHTIGWDLIADDEEVSISLCEEGEEVAVGTISPAGGLELIASVDLEATR